MSARPPRVLISAVAGERQWPWEAWSLALRQLRTDLFWDVALADVTDYPSDGYLADLRAWQRSHPFGPHHGVRLIRIGYDVDHRLFSSSEFKRRYAERELWGKFQRWASYDYLLRVEIDALPPVHGLQELYESGEPIALADFGVLLRGDIVRSVSYDIGRPPLRRRVRYEVSHPLEVAATLKEEASR